MYATDLYNFSGNTTQAISHVRGGLLAAWGDATESDSGDAWQAITPYIFGKAVMFVFSCAAT